MRPNRELRNYIEISHYWLKNLGMNWRRAQLYDRDWRFYCNLDRGASVAFNGREYPLVPGRYYLIPPLTKMISSIEPGTDPRQFFIHFRTGNPHNRVSRGIYSFPLDQAMAEKLGALRRDLEETGRRGSHRGILICLSLVATALGRLPESSFRGNIRDSRIARVLEILDEGAEANLSVLARKTELNKNSLIRLFKKEVGCTPYRYLTQRRVEQAIKLMENSSLSLEEISERCGYCDRYQFSRMFKSVMGESPGGYRKSLAASRPSQSRNSTTISI